MTGQAIVVDGGSTVGVGCDGLDGSQRRAGGCRIRLLGEGDDGGSGKVAIVTGAASGIGKATRGLVRARGRDGDRRRRRRVGRRDRGRRRARGATSRPGRASRCATHGGLDIFFANAGISGGLASIFEQTPEDWQEILRVNLIGPFLAIKHAAPAMKERGGGSIICTACVAGIRAGAGGPAYSASKAGVISLVEVAATQLCGANIRVNAICPGLIETGMTQRASTTWPAPPGKEEMIGHLNPLKRGGVPTRSPMPRLFLASDESSYVNGHALVVDGGLSASHPHYRQEYGRTSF